MNRKLVIAAVAASALAVGGTTAAFAGESDDTASSAVQAQNDDRDDRDDRGADDDGDDAKALSGAGLTAKEAIDKALAKVDGTVESVELDDEDGRLAWEADVLGENGTWHEVRIDADSGKVLHAQTDADDRDDADDKGDDRDDG